MQYLRLILFSILVFSSCKEKVPDLNKMNYPEMHSVVSEITCKKMQTCFNYIYRTFPSDILQESGLEDCKKNILKGYEKKVNSHSIEIQTAAISCYSEIIQANCSELIMIPIISLSCIHLRELLDRDIIFKKNLEKKEL